MIFSINYVINFTPYCVYSFIGGFNWWVMSWWPKNITVIDWWFFGIFLCEIPIGLASDPEIISYYSYSFDVRTNLFDGRSNSFGIKYFSFLRFHWDSVYFKLGNHRRIGLHFVNVSIKIITQSPCTSSKTLDLNLYLWKNTDACDWLMSQI